MTLRLRTVLFLGLALLPVRAARAADVPTDLPPTPREFRGLWVATVSNIDWPPRKDLSTAQQKASLIAILDRAAKLHLNAIVLQVRPACDALYPSDLEPWSEYLTGAQGRPPSPYYDPLQFAVDEAHKRGLELHAWFNPFRARHPSAKSPAAANHISVTRPDLVRAYGTQQWLDPGEPDARQYSLNVIFDVVKRYDIDAIHMDDYFYPYKERDGSHNIIDFPDNASYRKYQAGGGTMARDDWRRQNISTFVADLYHGVKALKPWVKVGISPFGIWRPGNPPGIKGLDPFLELYADSRAWLTNGWADYFAPQLYWKMSALSQSYPSLLSWWGRQNPLGRHLWPGINDDIGADDITSQVAISRREQNGNGVVHWHSANWSRNAKFVDRMATLYAQQALIPASPWLDNVPPATPTLTVADGQAAWGQQGDEPSAQWVVKTKTGANWTVRILPTAQTSLPWAGKTGDIIAVSAVDRCGNESIPAVESTP